MPHSDSEGKNWALARYLDHRPHTVLDLGVGAGTYARLMRPHHLAHWTAIEAWAPYARQFNLASLYDRVIIADARHLCWYALATADLAIAGDVLEHMTRPQARDIIAHLKATAHAVLISIPVLHLPQGAVGGNPFEQHVDHWTYDDMLTELGDGVTDTWRGDVLAYYWWRRP